MPNPDLESQEPQQPVRRRTGTPPAVRILDTLIEAILYLALIASPWLFGTTLNRDIYLQIALGLTLGTITLARHLLLHRAGQPTPGWHAGGPGCALSNRLTTALLALSAIVLAYGIIYPLNARMLYEKLNGAWVTQYLEAVPWLPMSYDRWWSWFAWWQYLALACFFWSVKNWASTQTRWDRIEASEGRNPLPQRFRRLLWVLSISGGLLALEGILQRLEGSGHLLFLIKPHINQSADGQFGPYAYRSNAAQYLNLIWPLSLGFWWVLRREHLRLARSGSNRVGSGSHTILLPLTVLMAAAPVISTSRGGTLIAIFLLFASLASLFGAARHRNIATILGLSTLGVLVLGLAGFLGWSDLEPRLRTLFKDDTMSGRTIIYENSRPIAKDFPWVGTGPGTFPAIYDAYRGKAAQDREAYLHNDYLQTRIEWGRIGMTLLLTALALAWIPSALRTRHTIPPLLTLFLWLTLAGCLLHARFDFPFQVFSILQLFLVLLALTLAHGSRPSLRDTP